MAHGLKSHHCSGGSLGRRLHWKQMCALNMLPPPRRGRRHQFARQALTNLAHFRRARARYERHGALQRVATQHGVYVVRQCVVNLGFYVAVKAQHTLCAPVRVEHILKAVCHVVGQCAGLPAGKDTFFTKMLKRVLSARPSIAALAADSPRRNSTNQLRDFGCGQRFGFPTSQNR